MLKHIVVPKDTAVQMLSIVKIIDSVLFLQVRSLRSLSLAHWMFSGRRKHLVARTASLGMLGLFFFFCNSNH